MVVGSVVGIGLLCFLLGLGRLFGAAGADVLRFVVCLSAAGCFLYIYVYINGCLMAAIWLLLNSAVLSGLRGDVDRPLCRPSVMNVVHLYL